MLQQPRGANASSARQGHGPRPVQGIKQVTASNSILRALKQEVSRGLRLPPAAGAQLPLLPGRSRLPPAASTMPSTQRQALNAQLHAQLSTPSLQQ